MAKCDGQAYGRSRIRYTANDAEWVIVLIDVFYWAVTDLNRHFAFCGFTVFVLIGGTSFFLTVGRTSGKWAIVLFFMAKPND